MRPADFFLGFLDRFSLRRLLSAWKVAVLVGCSSTLAGYLWIYRYVQIHMAGVEHLHAEYFLVASGLGGVFMALVLGFAIPRSLTRQVRGMAEMARRLEMRDFKDYPTAIPEGDFGEVIQAFLDMRTSVIGYETELRTAVDLLRATNHSLGEREAFLRTLVQSASVGILTQDRNSRILSINPFLQRLLGYTDEELVGSEPETWLDPQDIQAFYRKLSGFYGCRIESGRSLHDAMGAMGPFPPQELRLIRRDGAKVPVMIAVSLLRGINGASLGLLSVVTDLTALKTLELELRERESEAQAGNHAKSAFLAAMSHEVRTPLIGINGMIEVLSMGNLDEQQRQDVNILHHSAQSLLQIIGNILDFSKIEAGKLELAHETVSVLDLMEASVANFAQTASSKGLQIRCDTSHAVNPAHVADPLRLQQILNNFLSNAVKFTHEGQVTARVRCLDSTLDADRLVFEVEDTGIGISQQNQAKLFQPFAQAETSTTRRFGGTGLGLAICRHLGGLMGGEITMRSSLGKGTTMAFTVTLPIGDVRGIAVKEPPDRRETARFIRAKPSIEQAQAERSLILLAEDHPTNRAVLTRQLNLAGFALEVAEDGLAALDLWKTGRHALVFTDLHMPGLDGYQLTSSIRRWERDHSLARTPVIALTANVLQGEAERCLELGMDDYLTKPVGIPVLVAKLRQWLPHLEWLPRPRPMNSCTVGRGKLSSPPGPPGNFANDALLRLGGNDPAAALEILEDFRSATRADLTLLTQFYERRDQESLARQAHRIRGASAMVGAGALAQKAMELETCARRGDWAEIRVSLDGMWVELDGLAAVE